MPDTVLIEIGTQLRAARLAHGLTQQDVATLAGISRPRYRDIETGNVAARTSTLLNIARALGLEVMLIPQAIVPAINALLDPDTDDDTPAFQPKDDSDADPIR